MMASAIRLGYAPVLWTLSAGAQLWGLATARMPIASNARRAAISTHLWPDFRRAWIALFNGRGLSDVAPIGERGRVSIAAH